MPINPEQVTPNKDACDALLFYLTSLSESPAHFGKGCGTTYTVVHENGSGLCMVEQEKYVSVLLNPIVLELYLLSKERNRGNYPPSIVRMQKKTERDISRCMQFDTLFLFMRLVLLKQWLGIRSELRL